MPPLFSVVIPAYNRGPALAETLRSALDQTFADFEILVVDDGSTDDTAAVAESFAPAVRVLRKANGGVGSARNLGIAEAKGEYIAFLDADDLWFPWTLATYARAIAEHDRPTRLYAPNVSSAPGDDLSHLRPEPFAARAWPDYLAEGAPGFDAYPSSCVARRDALLATGGFFEHRHHMEEADCWLRLAALPGYVRVESPPCAAHVWHAANASNCSATFRVGMHYLIRAERQGAYPGGPSRRWERRLKIASAVRTGTLWCLKDRQPLPALRLYLATLPWNLRLGKLPYLAAFPCLALANRLGLYTPR
jgi:glycosyltransferase involved in cell wall biosynthesis